MRGEFDVVKLIFLSFATEREGVSGGDGDEAQEEFDVKDVLGTSWGQFVVVRDWDGLKVEDWYIEGTDLVALFSLLLGLVDYKPFEFLQDIGERFSESKVKQLRKSAQAMVRAICEKSNSRVIDELRITFDEFKSGIEGGFPNVLEPLGLLFDELLYQQKVKGPVEESTDKEIASISTTTGTPTTTLTTYATRGQLYSIFGPMINSMVKLYSGSEAGFSMRSFETKVFNWNAPSILIISGKRLSDSVDPHINSSRIRYFNDLIPPVRAKNTRKSKTVTFGAYVESPWRANSKECFANNNSKLFQLFPTHNVYKPSTNNNKNYAYFSRGEGIGFGAAPPQNNKYSNTFANISLLIESSFEFAVFRHFGQGGSFEPGPSSAEKSLEYEDRFIINEIEVWGCGTEQHLADQKLRWEWEEREAMNRQRINIDTLGEDRALLEMAGLVGKYSQSGGSV